MAQPRYPENTSVSASSSDGTTGQQQPPKKLEDGLRSTDIHLSVNAYHHWLLGREPLELLPMTPSPDMGKGLWPPKGTMHVERPTKVEPSATVPAEKLSTYSIFPCVPNVPMGRNSLQRNSHKGTGSFRTSTVPRHTVSVVGTYGPGPAPLTTSVVSPCFHDTLTDPGPARLRDKIGSYPGDGPCLQEDPSKSSSLGWPPSRTVRSHQPILQSRPSRRLSANQTARIGRQAQGFPCRSNSIAGPIAVPITPAHGQYDDRVSKYGYYEHHGLDSSTPSWPLPGPVIMHPGSALLPHPAHQVPSGAVSMTASPGSTYSLPYQFQPLTNGDSNSAPARAKPPYIAMLESTNRIPRMHNILASAFTWIILVAFVVFPATFSWPPPEPLVLQQYCLLGLAVALAALGTLGTAVMGFRWCHNYVWLLNRIFLPGALNGLAGLLATCTAIYTIQLQGVPQAQVWSPLAISAISFEGTVFLVCCLLFALYSKILLGRMKTEYERDLENGTQATRKGSESSQRDGHHQDGNAFGFIRNQDENQAVCLRHGLRSPPLVPGSVF